MRLPEPAFFPKVDSELAKENMLSGYDAQLPDGKIPLHIRPGKEHAAEPPITAGRSQHIVQGLTLWNTYLHTKDKEWAEHCYQSAKKANLWWFSDRGDGQKYRDPLNWGLLGFGYDPEAEMGILGARLQPYVGKAQYAYFETYDDSPQWTTGAYFKSVAGLQDITEDDVDDESKYIEQYHTADIYTLERCCLYAVDCDCLSKLANALGYAEDAAIFAEKHRQMAQRINERMWCEEDGCYYNLKFDGTLSKKQSPDCFMPLMTGCVPADRKERLLAILKDENKFWGDYMIPSIAKDDPAFPNQASAAMMSSDQTLLPHHGASSAISASLGSATAISVYPAMSVGSPMVTLMKYWLLNAPWRIALVSEAFTSN